MAGEIPKGFSAGNRKASYCFWIEIGRLHADRHQAGLRARFYIVARLSKDFSDNPVDFFAGIFCPAIDSFSFPFSVINFFQNIVIGIDFVPASYACHNSSSMAQITPMREILKTHCALYHSCYVEIFSTH
jgi:hypothetical protein